MANSRKHSLTLTEVLQRAMAYSEDDVHPIAAYLKMDKAGLDLGRKNKTHENAQSIAAYLCKMGSNDVATLFRGGNGVAYDEVVYDVGKSLKAKVVESASIEFNEGQIITKLFADALDQMSEDEKRELLQSIGIKKVDLPLSAAGTVIIQQLLKHYGGFTVYKLTLVLSNMIARALLGKGLTFAANAAISRTIGLALGPVGWIVTGAWLAIDLMGPAYRKTVPSIVHVAMLRQIIQNRISIGVVGDGSVGKDALFKSVFGVDTGNVSPIAGSTIDTQVYEQDEDGSVQLVNFPGFNDFRPDVESLTNDHLNHTDIFVLVVDVNRGISNTDIEILSKLKAYNRPVLVCLNKLDLVRPNDKEKLLLEAASRLKGADSQIETAFDPDPRLYSGDPIGAEEVFNWVKGQLADAGKNTDQLKRGSL